MHITLEADYAVRIVDALSRSSQRMEARAIAQVTGVTLRFSLKILRKLVACGIVRSYRGALGGYEMAVSPSEVSVYQVLEVIEGPLVLNRCLLEGTNCTRVPDKKCPYHYLFEHLTDQLKAQLSVVTFASVIESDKLAGVTVRTS